MLSMDFDDNEYPRAVSWEKVTKRVVDPITFSCTADVAFVPRIEDCSYETTCFAICHPRFGENLNPGPLKQSSKNNKKGGNGTKGTTWTPMNLSPGTALAKNSSKQPSPAKVQPSAKVPSLFAGSKKPVLKKGSSPKPSSLGSFFSKDTAQKIEELDNQSLSSRSMNSRSVADRSHAERSKGEERMAQKAQERRGGNSEKGKRRHKRRDSKESRSMQSIDEKSRTDFSENTSVKEDEKAAGSLGNFLQQKFICEDEDKEDDQKSTISGSSFGTKTLSDRSRTENELKANKAKGKRSNGLSTFLEGSQSSLDIEKDEKAEEKSLTLQEIGPVVKKLRFKDGHEAREIPALTSSMYDDLFYASEELADFRYEAFLVEAGLDVDEYMNM
jgi:hypothetical protein